MSDTSVIAMIPARMGSQRLEKKNLRLLGGVPLITRAIRNCKTADCFDEIWVNSEHHTFKDIAEQEKVKFHQRPQLLGNNVSTSEDYITDFLQHHECHLLVQVHSIAPLLAVTDIKAFVNYFCRSRVDCLLSSEDVQIECAYKNRPVNFTFNEKTNSQDLTPIQRVSWSITGWRRDVYMQAAQNNRCATYAGRVDFFPVNRLAAHVIKTEDDLKIAEALLPFVENY